MLNDGCSRLLFLLFCTEALEGSGTAWKETKMPPLVCRQVMDHVLPTSALDSYTQEKFHMTGSHSEMKQLQTPCILECSEFS